ncbi:beta-ketoacyl synthase [Nocardioides sp. L-11A]|uniref:beta-ketoacyl-[acyl-carrier-protein] synthase family protein n=1 Tax=Nocardioides sp. L-11A TaxID=3043848 RepID=UPI00249BED1C|nr:beta-ketoacyl-[acyl-carrier-protein] synthase family protein [Nocardioides sp. L-11A]
MSRENAGVAITGIGAITALGHSPAEFTAALDEGRTALFPAAWADPGSPASWASTVSGFDPLDWMDPRLADGTDLFAQYALAAAQQAVEDHGQPLEPGTGVVIGTTMAGVTSLTEAQRRLDLVGPEAVPRKLNIQAWPNMAAGQIAIRYALHGPLLTVSTACASSIDAIGTALGMIQTGRADVVIAGGTERGLCEVLHHSQASYGMTNQVTDPMLSTMPFDRRRTGLVEGEGAAIVVLENLERARERGATIHGVLAGYGSLSDGSHPSSPDPSGSYEAQAMRDAQRMAGVTPDEVTGLVAHATSTPKGDTVEISAINQVFGERDDDLHVTSIKGSVGHTGAASGGMGLLLALHAIATGRLAHIPTTHEVEDGARFHIVTEKPAVADFHTVQVNAFGFGGQNSSIIVRRA